MRIILESLADWDPQLESRKRAKHTKRNRKEAACKSLLIDRHSTRQLEKKKGRETLRGRYPAKSTLAFFIQTAAQKTLLIAAISQWPL